jgi:hypothetical protein
MDPAKAAEDFRNRIKNYEKTYETIQDDSLSYVKVSQQEFYTSDLELSIITNIILIVFGFIDN